MLDGAAIAHREQPDIFLKPNDQVIVGTNFWALPLAIIRNGFRSSYGFGFVLDRNLSNDLLGPEAIRQVTQ
jgi:polysaccharide biosynthesis/export protein